MFCRNFHLIDHRITGLAEVDEGYRSALHSQRTITMGMPWNLKDQLGAAGTELQRLGFVQRCDESFAMTVSRTVRIDIDELVECIAQGRLRVEPDSGQESTYS